MRRPRPSANTVSTVSTSPFLISDSRPFGSARSSGTVRSPDSDRRRDGQQAAQSAAILPARGQLWQYAQMGSGLELRHSEYACAVGSRGNVVIQDLTPGYRIGTGGIRRTRRIRQKTPRAYRWGDSGVRSSSGGDRKSV